MEKVLQFQEIETLEEYRLTRAKEGEYILLYREQNEDLRQDESWRLIQIHNGSYYENGTGVHLCHATHWVSLMT